MSLSAKHIESLSRITGPAGVVGSDADMTGFLTEWRDRYTGMADLILMPATTQEISRIARYCNEQRIGIVPQGGNTGLCGGAIPFSTDDSAQILLSMRRLAAVRKVDAEEFTVAADAGVTISTLQECAEGVDRLFALSLASEGTATLGGTISTNAGGVNVLRYGTMREQVLGLEVVLPDGRVLDQMAGLRKDNTGYRLTELFIGSEGTLGIVTGAVCRLFPRPRSFVTALLACNDFASCVTACSALRGRSSDITALEAFSGESKHMVLTQMDGVTDPFAGDHAWYLLVELSCPDTDPRHETALGQVLNALIESGDVADATLATSLSQRDALWRLRHHLSEAQKRKGPSYKHDVSVPLADMAPFIDRATRRLAQEWPDCELVIFGHLGDGNLHFNVMAAPGWSIEEFESHRESVQSIVLDEVGDAGGSFSAEHGIGLSRRDIMAERADPLKLELMRVLKSALDPGGILNPGKVLDG